MKLADIETERAAIACALQDSAAANGLVVELDVEAFTTPAHRRAFEGIRHVLRSGADVDLTTVGQTMQEAGGYAVLREVLGSETLPGNWRTHVGHLKFLTLKRAVVARAELITRDVPGMRTPEQVREALSELSALEAAREERRPASVSESLQRLKDRLEADAAGRGRPAGVLCGLPHFDRQGGLPRGELTTIGGRPSHGKSALALHVVRTALAEGNRVFMVSLEMPEESVMVRAVASESGVAAARMKDGKRLRAEDWTHAVGAMSRLSERRLDTWDPSSATVPQIDAWVRWLNAKHGKGDEIDMLVVDYLQLIGGAGGRKAYDTRNEEVGSVSRGLKQLAKRYGIAVVAPAQLGREVERRDGGTPRLIDLRESGSLEADSNIVMTVQNPRMSKPTSEDENLHITVLKWREGSIGRFEMHYDRSTQRISEPES